MKAFALLLMTAGWVLCADKAKLPPPAAFPVDFTRDIEPLLKARCQGCHGPNLQSSGLRLDNALDALKGGYSGAVIRPGASAASRLIQLVAGVDDKLVMPPVGARLSPEEVGLLRAWIDAGASWPISPTGDRPASTGAKTTTHWAWQPIRHPVPPQTRNKYWARNSIDSFILERLEREGIEPSPEAPRTTLIRRLYLDLIGLPPTPEDIADFLADNRPDSYERLVDRLLESPHYGEKWAFSWLGSSGSRSNWRYRHWLIGALNNDLPFDQFTIQQIAGDLLTNSTVEQKVATGFLRDEPSTSEECRIANRVAKVGAAWLGMTLRCGQCEDRPCNPAKRSDFNRLYPLFENTREAVIDAPLPGEMGPFLAASASYLHSRDVLLRQYQIRERQATWENKMREALSHPGISAEGDRIYQNARRQLDSVDWLLNIPPEQRTRNQSDAMTDCFVRNNPQMSEIRTKLDALRAASPTLSEASVIVETSAARRSTAHAAAAEGFLPLFPASNRLALANWLLSSANSLTPRVIVNRMWTAFFGRGFFEPEESFGSRAEQPYYPLLLDWLAIKFQDLGWHVKAMHRLIVTSAAYRQSSDERPELENRDTKNTLLARQTKQRLTDPLFRDALLEVSDLLDTSIGGTRGATQTGRYRRSLYLAQVEEGLPTEAARALAARLLHALPPSGSAQAFSQRVRLGFLICFSRPPTAKEQEALHDLYVSQMKNLEKNSQIAATIFPVQVDGFTTSEAAVWTVLSGKLLEYDEFKIRD